MKLKRRMRVDLLSLRADQIYHFFKTRSLLGAKVSEDANYLPVSISNMRRQFLLFTWGGWRKDVVDKGFFLKRQRQRPTPVTAP